MVAGAFHESWRKLWVLDGGRVEAARHDGDADALSTGVFLLECFGIYQDVSGKMFRAIGRSHRIAAQGLAHAMDPAAGARDEPRENQAIGRLFPGGCSEAAERHDFIGLSRGKVRGVGNRRVDLGQQARALIGESRACHRDQQNAADGRCLDSDQCKLFMFFSPGRRRCEISNTSGGLFASPPRY